MNTLKIGSYSVVVGSKISEGGFANVYRAKGVNTGEVFALKKIFLRDKEVEMVQILNNTYSKGRKKSAYGGK